MRPDEEETRFYLTQEQADSVHFIVDGELMCPPDCKGHVPDRDHVNACLGDQVERWCDERKPVLLVPGYFFVGWPQILCSPMWVAFDKCRLVWWRCLKKLRGRS
jgi:hypothetical protein